MGATAAEGDGKSIRSTGRAPFPRRHQGPVAPSTGGGLDPFTFIQRLFDPSPVESAPRHPE